MKREIDDNKGEITHTKKQIMVQLKSVTTKRLDALINGYKGNYERQEELAQDMENVKSRVDCLETKAG